MQKIISIITVTKNDIARLKITINSLTSFYDDNRYEFIIIDGGSSDGTIDYLETLKNIKNINYQSRVDSGIYDAMNTGIKLGKGNFLIFLNCGDRMIISPDELIQCIGPYIEKIPVNILCFNFEEEFGALIKRRIVGKIKANALPCTHQAMLFSSKYIKNNIYNTKYEIGADYDLYTRSLPSMILAIENSDVMVRVEGLGFASSNPMRAYREYLDIAGRNFKGLKRIRVMSVVMARAIAVISIKSLVPKTAYNFLKNIFG